MFKTYKVWFTVKITICLIGKKRVQDGNGVSVLAVEFTDFTSPL